MSKGFCFITNSCPIFQMALCKSQGRSHSVSVYLSTYLKVCSKHIDRRKSHCTISSFVFRLKTLTDEKLKGCVLQRSNISVTRPLDCFPNLNSVFLYYIAPVMLIFGHHFRDLFIPTFIVVTILLLIINNSFNHILLQLNSFDLSCGSFAVYRVVVLVSSGVVQAIQHILWLQLFLATLLQITGRLQYDYS